MGLMIVARVAQSMFYILYLSRKYEKYTNQYIFNLVCLNSKIRKFTMSVYLPRDVGIIYNVDNIDNVDNIYNVVNIHIAILIVGKYAVALLFIYSTT